MDYSNLSIIIPTKNEEKAIGKVLDDIIELTRDEAEISVIDSSIDQTAEIALEKGVNVIKSEASGIGNAVILGFDHASRDIILKIDGDGTYPIDEIPNFLKKINEGFDLVGANRLKGFYTPNMPKLHIFGNYIFVMLVSLLYGKRILDVTSGMRMFRRHVIKDNVWERNAGLSTEMIIKSIIRNYKIYEFSINYQPRIGTSKLNSFTDGLSILITILMYRKNQILAVFLLLFIIILSLLQFVNFLE